MYHPSDNPVSSSLIKNDVEICHGHALLKTTVVRLFSSSMSVIPVGFILDVDNCEYAFLTVVPVNVYE